MMRRLVMASSVERTRIHAQARKTSPTTTINVRMPSRTRPNCDHHETRARWTSTSPSINESSMYDMSVPDVRGVQEDVGERLEAAAVVFVEAREVGTVQVEDADHLAETHERHDDLAPRVRVACDVAGKGVHVRHDDRFLVAGGGSAHALAQRDANAGRLALEGAEDQAFLLQEIEPGPVEVGEAMEQQRREVRGVGYEIVLALEKRVGLLEELCVEGLLGVVLAGGCAGEHGGLEDSHDFTLWPEGGPSAKSGPTPWQGASRQLALGATCLSFFSVWIFLLCFFCAFASLARSLSVTTPSDLAFSFFVSTLACPFSSLAVSLGVRLPDCTPCWMRAS